MMMMKYELPNLSLRGELRAVASIRVTKGEGKERRDER